MEEVCPLELVLLSFAFTRPGLHTSFVDQSLLPVKMRSPAAAFEALPSEILTMFYRNVDSIFDLQNMMLASPHVWRHVAVERQIPSILDDLLQETSVHPQLAFAIRIAAHLRCESPSLMKLLNRLGLRAFEPDLNRASYAFFPNENYLDILPQDMKPIEVRRLLTTSFAINATTLHCVSHHLCQLHSLRPLTVEVGKGIKFDMRKDDWTDLPTSPRSPVPDTGPILWQETQQMLKAFWMISVARLFFAARKSRAFEIPERWRDMEVDDMSPIDLFGFERQGKLDYHERNRPRDYLFHSMQLFLTAEEYLKSVKPVDDWPLTTITLPCKRTSKDTEDWPEVSETMEHFVRLFKEIRSLTDGDGFHPWRRLGFAIWDIERLRTAGLVHDYRHDRNDDRVRWLSVIREEDFGTVRSHRLSVSDVEKGLVEMEGMDYDYPADSDESSNEVPWDYSVYFIPEDTSRKSLSLEFGRQARDGS